MLNGVLATSSYSGVVNYLFANMLERIAAMLATWDNNQIPDPSYYWELAWNGLTFPQVRAWSNRWPNFLNWPPSNPALSDNDKQGLKYALTLARIDSIYNHHIPNELQSLPNAKGRKRQPNECF